jgi:transcriptional regulator with XRE-family HTH domain
MHYPRPRMRAEAAGPSFISFKDQLCECILTSLRQPNGRAVLGQRVRELRKQLGKTLQDIGRLTGLSKSTLSKIENGTLSVSYDNLVKLAKGLSIDLAALFAEGHAQLQPLSSGRRSVTRKGSGEIYETAMYRYELLCTDLNPRKIFPIIAKLRAHSVSSAKELIRHSGEEFAFVLEGTVEVHSEFYNPLTLTAGDAIYFDSTMGHALISVGAEDARILWVATDASDAPTPQHSAIPNTKAPVRRPAKG